MISSDYLHPFGACESRVEQNAPQLLVSLKFSRYLRKRLSGLVQNASVLGDVHQCPRVAARRLASNHSDPPFLSSSLAR